MKHFATAFLLLSALAGCTTFDRDQPSVFVVFFPKASAELSPDAQRIVDQAAQAVRGTHPQSVVVASGALTGDDLAQPRFTAVHQALVSDGVDTALIARASIPDGVAEVGGTGDYRVEIRLVRKALTTTAAVGP